MAVGIVECIGNNVDLSCELKHRVFGPCKCHLWEEKEKQKSVSPPKGLYSSAYALHGQSMSVQCVLYLVKRKQRRILHYTQTCIMKALQPPFSGRVIFATYVPSGYINVSEQTIGIIKLCTTHYYVYTSGPSFW